MAPHMSLLDGFGTTRFTMSLSASVSLADGMSSSLLPLLCLRCLIRVNDGGDDGGREGRVSHKAADVTGTTTTLTGWELFVVKPLLRGVRAGIALRFSKLQVAECVWR